MPQRCATLAELLIAAPEFLTTGGLSTGVLTFASNPAPGDVITLATQYGVPLATETYVADTDFVIGVDAAATAGNFATALHWRPDNRQLRRFHGVDRRDPTWWGRHRERGPLVHMFDDQP
jgi:hypothetical protein